MQSKRESKSKTHEKIKIIIPLIVVLIVGTIIAIVYIINNSGYRDSQGNKIEVNEEEAKVLNGTYVYNENTKYTFDGIKEGTLYCPDGEFKYIYVIQDSKLKLYFEDDDMRDATYLFNLADNKLTLIGGAGTTGGTFVLNKEGN